MGYWFCSRLTAREFCPQVTACVASFLELIAEKCHMGPMLFQLSLFCLFSELLNHKHPERVRHWDVHGERLQRLAGIVLTEFFAEFDRDPAVAGAPQNHRC